MMCQRKELREYKSNNFSDLRYKRTTLKYVCVLVDYKFNFLKREFIFFKLPVCK